MNGKSLNHILIVKIHNKNVNQSHNYYMCDQTLSVIPKGTLPFLLSVCYFYTPLMCPNTDGTLFSYTSPSHYLAPSSKREPKKTIPFNTLYL